VDDTECWPTGNSVSMNDLNVAAAMERGGIVGQVFNAANGLPLTGARVTAYQGIALKGFGGLVDELGSELFRIINVPASLTSTTTLTLKVTKTGFTTGAQAFGTIDTAPGAQVGLPRVSVPKNLHWWFVTEWTGESGPGVPYEFDQYVYLPFLAPIQCAVGKEGLCGLGSLVVAPFVQAMHDGGPLTASTSMESSALRRPLYSTTTGLTPYEVFLDSYDDTNGAVNFQDSSGALTRVWLNGVLKATVSIQDATESIAAPCADATMTTESDCAWHIGNLASSGIFTPVNELGAFCHAGSATCPVGVTPPGIAPYSHRDRRPLHPVKATVVPGT